MILKEHYKYAVVSDSKILTITVSNEYIPHNMCEYSLIDVDIEIEDNMISICGNERSYGLFLTRNFDPKTIARYEDHFIEYTSVRKKPYIIGRCRLKKTTPFKMIGSAFALYFQ